MVQPIQYQIPGVSPDPFAGVLQGLKIGGSLAEMDAMRAQRALQQQQLQQQIQQRQAAMEQQQRFQTGLQTALANPNRTWQDLEPLLAIAPNKEQADAVKTMMSGADARVLQNEKNFAANVLLAIESDPTVAKKLLDTRSEAEQDPQKKQLYQTVTKALDVSPQQAGNLLELGGAQIYGKDWYEGITKVRNERRAAELQPSTLAEAQAKAREAEAKAIQANVELRTLANRRDAELRSAQSAAEKAAVEARYADSAAQAALAKSRAETELAIVRMRAAGQEQLPTSARETNWYMQQPPEVQRTWRELKSSVNPPVYNAEARGFIVAPTADNPNGSFIPMGEQIQMAQDRTNAVKALRGVGYNPETGEDNVTRIIKKSTNGGLEALTDNVFRFFGQDTEGARAIAALGSVANQMTLDLSGGRLGAGVSNADREFLLSSLGDLANPNKTVGERIAAWGMARNRMITLGMLPPPKKKAQVAAPSLTPLPGPAPTTQAAPAQMAPAAPAAQPTPAAPQRRVEDAVTPMVDRPEFGMVVTLPDGRSVTFKSREHADAFRAQTGLK